MLERANLFIVPLDEERRWYRYHHLFSDLLRQRLVQQHPGWVPILHGRASEWYEQNGFADEAIEHALGAQDLERAANLIEEYVDELWQRGEHTRLRRWLARLPIDLACAKPDLCILRAWDQFIAGQQDAAEQSLQAIEEALGSGDEAASETRPAFGGQPPALNRNRVRGRAATIRAFLAGYRGDVPEAIQYARQALETLPEDDLTWRSTATVALSDIYSFSGQLEAAIRARREAIETSKSAGNIYMALIASMKLAVSLRSKGHLQQAIEMCQQQVQLAETSGWSQTPVVGCLLAVWGEVLAELDDLNGALERAKTGVDLTERGSDVAMIGWSNLCLMMVLFSRGELAGAARIIQKLQSMARERDLATFVTKPMAAWQARIWLAQGQLDAAVQWLGEHRLETDGDLGYLHDLDYVDLAEYVGLARVLLAQGRLEDATRLLQPLLDRSSELGHTSRVIQVLILQALALEAGGYGSQAMTALEQGLALAQPAGFVRIFVNEGPPMARLLHKAAAHGIAPEYSARLLNAFGTADDADADVRRQTTDRGPSASSVVDGQSYVVHRSSPDLVEPLSERELEVLGLIAEGLTNREIASRLFLALNTVKAHTRNIYGKLDVHSRTQAIARAQALGLLPRSS
jgi:LuxR family maltose regulon positive regulatory protein